MMRKRVGVLTVLSLITTLLVAAGVVAAADCFLYSADVGYVCDVEPAPQTFVAPDMPAFSLLDEVRYAYIEDNTNVYPEPSAAVAPKYNVGVGFLYVTIAGELEVNGQHWYMINNGEYVEASALREVEISSFRGTEVHLQPQRPFGWIVLKVVPSATPAGPPHPQFSELPRYTFLEVFDAATADDGWI
jgi:hypothetical protein